ncbi:helix-turn-helix transcriptional regulator [Prevotella corporis]|uniref:DNA-binding helix-turn-helix protein n=1 Tax=Prevotella corporis TaxID=28128 RepID=A0A133QLS7_9BACT|nr:helix-turn-helix transcriptional regulator [Prevotella corporis]KXA43824.1 DNA-binding helix-turn-helix protein [Prevotella corporis]MDQ7736463.1 helix-turn-helix transcriptional regulator [Prevotella corporis]
MKLNKIKEVLDSKGVSQTWLAKQLGKSFSTVNCYARNKYQPDLETLLEISKILEVNLKDLITDENERV